MAEKKTKEQLAQELQQKALKKYLDEIEKLNEKHHMRLVPVINYTPQGIHPVFNVENIPQVEYKKADAKKTKQKPDKGLKNSKE